MLGRFLRAGGRQLERFPRNPYGHAYAGGWRAQATPREINAAARDLERDEGLYNYERDLRPVLASLMLGAAIAPTAAGALVNSQHRDQRDLRRRRGELSRQRRLLDALNSELQFASIANLFDDPSPWMHTLEEGEANPIARSQWAGRLNRRERTRERLERMRDVASRLNSDYRGYEGRDVPEVGLIYDRNWDAQP